VTFKVNHPLHCTVLYKFTFTVNYVIGSQAMIPSECTCVRFH